jgi:hypothetical protein
MNKKSLESISQPGPGDRICLLIGNWDPPTNDLRHACEALGKVPGISRVWICPIIDETSKEDRTRVADLCNIFCTEFTAEHGKVVTCCTAGLDGGFKTAKELVKWVEIKMPTLKVCHAGFNIEHSNGIPTYSVRFSNQPYPKNKPDITLISLDKNVFIGDVREKILKGSDESRNMYYGVWTYIQAKRLYR